MSKIKKILIAVLAVIMTVCAGVALAACDNDPGFRNPDDDPSKDKYVVNVRSQGGLRLNDVKLSIKKDGEVKSEGITVNGVYEFTLEPGEYDIVIDESSLPAGYSLPIQKYRTSTEEKTVTIPLSSKVINSAAPANTIYRIGDVMYNFEVTDVVSGITYNLANMINSGDKKAVMLNFFGTACGPCMTEFPHINAAYELYKDKLEILAIANYSIPDTAEGLKTFKENNNYSFPVALDTPNLKAPFRMGQEITATTSRGWPTTVIIDRYGVVAEISTGMVVDDGSWRGMFLKYTGDDYSQEINQGAEESPTTVDYKPRPDGYTMPDDAAIKEAIGDSDGKIVSYYYDFTGEGEANTWPWFIGGEGGDKYLTVSNSDAAESFAIINVKLQLSPLDGIAFDYNFNTRAEANVLGVVMDGKTYFQQSGDSSGWQTFKFKDYNDESNLYYSTSTRTVDLSFVYQKKAFVDGATPVSIRNIRIYSAAAESGIKDFAISAIDGKQLNGNNSYNLDITKGDDGFYYYNYGDGEKSLLMVNINDITPWTDIHYGASTFHSPDDGTTLRLASLYSISYWHMSNWNRESEDEEDDIFVISYDPDDTIIFAYYLQDFSENGYLPVTDKLKDALIAFTKAAYDPNADLGELKFTGEWYEDQWLELCYYFRHLGADHTAGEKCWVTANPVEGLSFDYALTAYEGNTEVNVTSILNLWTISHQIEAGGGVKYKFTPDEDGVYCFSTTHTDPASDPNLIIVDPAKQHILVENDNDPRYDKLYVDKELNFDAFLYVELKAGQTYYITASVGVNLLGSFTMNIEYVGEYAEMIRVATSGAGFWTWREDENGNPETDANGNIIYYYIAQDVALNSEDGVYYRLTTDNDYDTPLYIDFVHPTYFDVSERSLKQLIDGNAFDSRLTEDEVAKLKEYCNKAVTKNESDKLYGLYEAESELVAILSKILGEQTATGEWQQAAVYIDVYGTK